MAVRPATCFRPHDGHCHRPRPRFHLHPSPGPTHANAHSQRTPPPRPPYHPTAPTFLHSQHSHARRIRIRAPAPHASHPSRSMPRTPYVLRPNPTHRHHTSMASLTHSPTSYTTPTPHPAHLHLHPPQASLRTLGAESVRMEVTQTWSLTFYSSNASAACRNGRLGGTISSMAYQYSLCYIWLQPQLYRVAASIARPQPPLHTVTVFLAFGYIHPGGAIACNPGRLGLQASGLGCCTHTREETAIQALSHSRPNGWRHRVACGLCQKSLISRPPFEHPGL